jgi:hypothetical protein
MSRHFNMFTAQQRFGWVFFENTIEHTGKYKFLFYYVSVAQLFLSDVARDIFSRFFLLNTKALSHNYSCELLLFFK